MVAILGESYFGSFFLRELRAPQVIPTRITTTRTMASEIMPVISVKYLRGGMEMEVGVGVGIKVGVEVAASVGDGWREAVGAANVDSRVEKLTVTVRVGARATLESWLFFWVEFSRMTAAWTEVKERRVPTRKVEVIRMNSRIMSALGKRGKFIGDPSIS